MSRSGYNDDCDDDPWAHIRWRGAVASSIKGARGQALLREIAAAMDAMPVKELAAESLVTEDGEFCTLGVAGAARGMNLAALDPEDYDAVAKAFGVATPLVREIVYLNDEFINDTEWEQEELHGPVRPNYPDWGRLLRSYERPVPHARARRWQYMRDTIEKWIAKSKGTP